MTLTPLDNSKTVRRPGRRGVEIWEATSDDGTYNYIRFEDTTTTWQVKHVSSGHLFPDFFGTLTASRRWTASVNPQPPVTAASLVATYRASLFVDEIDCDDCGFGRPCVCRADSTDPIESIYE